MLEGLCFCFKGDKKGTKIFKADPWQPWLSKLLSFSESPKDDRILAW
jgi:hypothetical protein